MSDSGRTLDFVANSRAPSVNASPSNDHWGSDYVAAVMRALEVPFIALVPGSSYRGLHDSILNYLGNRSPEVVLAINEETAVAIAHGYAKVTDRLMAVALHANVGLMRATMGIFNAWCDRMPMLLIGATGPWDAAKRRPWIDWIHTSTDQGGLIRNFTKWDNQPGSPLAAGEAVLRAAQIAGTAPRGPVYVNLDVSIQEAKVGALPEIPDAGRYAPPPRVEPAELLVQQAASLLSSARQPVILAGRCSRSVEGWGARVALAEKLHAPVVTHITLAAAFPTDHPLHVSSPGPYLSREAERLVEEADVVLSLDWLDLAGTLKQACRGTPFSGKVIHVSCDAHSHRGWSADHQGLPPVDVYMMCEPDAAVPALADAAVSRPHARVLARIPPFSAADDMSLGRVATAVRAATRGIDVCYTRVPLGWDGAFLDWRHPLDYIGHDGGAGVGSGPGITVGAALALKGSSRIPIALMGDGDFLMGNVAVWTAAHCGIPAVIVVCNNRSFHNDERHQARIADMRSRLAGSAHIGHSLSNPDIDIVGLARAQGAIGIGPVTDFRKLQLAIEQGIAAARSGRIAVVDVHVVPVS